MIEQTVIDYLTDAMDVSVGAQVPKGPPTSYCTVEKRGSSEKDLLQAALISVHSVAPSKWGAVCLSALVKTAMRRLPERAANVSACRCQTEYDSTDPKTKEYRYTAVFRLVYVED